MALNIERHNASNFKFARTLTDQYVADNTYTVSSGDVVSIGTLVLVALGNEDADGNFIGDFGAAKTIYNLTVTGADNLGNAAVSIGDAVYADGTAVNVDAANGVKYGIALGAVASGASTVIPVLSTI